MTKSYTDNDSTNGFVVNDDDPTAALIPDFAANFVKANARDKQRQQDIADVSDVADASLAKSNNLSDVVDASTTRSNLGLGTAATHPSTDFDAAGAAASAQSAAQSYVDSRIAANPPYLKYLEGVPFSAYGHSYIDGGNRMPDVPALVHSRLQNRHHMQTCNDQGVSGTRMDQIAARIASNWVANSHGLVLLIGAINDVLQYANDSTAWATCKEAFRTSLAYLTAKAVLTASSPAFAFGTGWSAGTTSTAGSYFDYAWNGDSSYVLLAGTTGAAKTVTVTRSGDGAAVKTANPGGLKNACTFAVRLSGFGSGDHTVRFTLTSGSSLSVVGAAQPGDTPVTVLWWEEGPVNWSIWSGALNTTLYNGYLAALLTTLESVAADFPSVIAVPSGSGWDRNTMIVTEDGLHANEIGNSYMADTLEAALKTSVGTFRQGLNNVARPAASLAYTPPIPFYTDGTVAAPGAPTPTAAPGNGRVVLNWTQATANGSPITQNNIYRSTVAGAEALVATIPAGTNYTDNGRTNGTTYYYKVSAVNGVGEGALSAEVSTTPSPIVASDTFTRANNSLSLGNAETGQAWLVVNGTWGIISNTAYRASASVDNMAVIDVASVDAVAVVTFTTIADTQSRLIWRFIDIDNYWLVQPTGTNYSIYKRVASVFTLAGTITATPTNGDVLTATTSGNTISVKVNSGTATVITDAASNTGTKFGLGTGGLASGGNARFDNFSVSV